MSFLSRLSTGVNKHLGNLKAAHDRQVARAEARARVRMATARTKVDKEKVKLALQREKLQLQKELAEARLATQKAKTATIKAKREAGDVGLGERVSRGASSVYRFLEGKPARKRKKRKSR